MQVLSWNYVISCDQGLGEESALAMLTMNGQLLECRNVLSTYWNVMQKFWFLYWKVIRATFLVYIRIHIFIFVFSCNNYHDYAKKNHHTIFVVVWQNTVKGSRAWESSERQTNREGIHK